MENKYYTPAIEEFHVGFECESNYVLANSYEKDNSKFVPFTFTEDNFAYMIDAYTNDAYTSEFRVKYLDKEDIESLGWEDWEPMGMSCFRINHNNKSPNGEFQLYQYDNNWITIYNDDSQYVFQGTIKNKSELQKLMKQLGII